ncbi:hypothetical protein TNCV_3213091 [Trichonephila clavipes]|nr:hypothetical protein TNCV_3213091 [Trichonephila clavipes]
MKLKLINQRVEPGEIMDINPDSESQFENSDEPETFESKGKFFKCYLKSSIKKNIKPRAYTRHCLKDTSEKRSISRSSEDNTMT